jgi:hypothetical protein
MEKASRKLRLFFLAIPEVEAARGSGLEVWPSTRCCQTLLEPENVRIGSILADRNVESVAPMATSLLVTAPMCYWTPRAKPSLGKKCLMVSYC